ncbi:FxLD family lanthipeptide [Streptomyces abikoensis]|uniref:FxLD family lanthipeptide n=1 Tax=Streptomyces abikoensis TaxID=97398 RepID=A0ABW7T4U8_9ACTN
MQATSQNSAKPRGGQPDFDLDITAVEVADPAGLVNVTDDGCGSTCGACVTNPS